MRLDQWLWAVRLYRTRTLAVSAIRGGHVKLNGASPKPANEVREGEVITARTGNVERVVRVRGFPTALVGAPRVAEFLDDLTPPPPPRDPSDPSTLPPPVVRPRGLGRPTKRDRRALDRWRE